MTCIIGLVNNGRVYIGGDSAGVDSHRLLYTTRADEKVFQRGQYLIGFTTSFRMGQVLRYGGSLPVPPDDSTELHKFMCTSFVDAIKLIFEDAGYGKKQGEEGDEGGQFIIGVKGRLFIVHADYQIEETTEGFSSVGCGDMLAFGALAVTGHMAPFDRITTCLNAVTRFSAGVRAPFLIKECIPDVDAPVVCDDAGLIEQRV